MTPVLLYDGSCGLCARLVQFVLRHERHGTLRFAPLGGPFAAAVRARHPELRDIDSMVWVEPSDGGAAERVLVRSDAALEVARYLDGPWKVALLGRVLPRSVRDALYAVLARHRHRLRLPERAPVCVVPTAETRARFLE